MPMRPKTLSVPQTLRTTLGFLIACGSPWAPSCSKDAISHQGLLSCLLLTNARPSLSPSLHFIVLNPFHSAMVNMGYFEISPLASLGCTLLPSRLSFLCPSFCLLFVAVTPHAGRITDIHHEGCKMHRGHYTSVRVAALTLGGLPCFCCMSHFTLITLVHVMYFVWERK